MFKNLKPTHKFVLTLVMIGLVLLFSYLIYKYFVKKRQQSLIDNNTATTTANGQGVTINIGVKAAEINDALHGSWWQDDEQKAINAVLSTPKPLIPNLSATYFALTGYNLNQDLQSYLSSSEYLQVKSQFE